ncbi:unnamed protein product [Phytophthora lilii]|uniref:Unnamed protein product n=1 Tax=Phytophthora lilii TaxID=2077276 RepID=A0A9W6XJT9_9STRA|nr:unnamed protein product [Phytophthora lilii]
MVKLFCAIVGVTGSAFEVKIDDAESVSALKDAIWEKIKDMFIHDDKFRSVVASRLQLFLAKKDGAWLTDDDDLDKMLQNQVDTSKMKKLRASWKLNKPDLFGPDVSLGEDVIHVLVLVPGQRLSVGAAALREPHPVRKKKWEELNEPSKVVENDKLDVLHAYLLLLTKAFGEIVTGKEAKRLHFIVPILACVCGLFDGEVRILAEETVTGKRVHGDGSFEFVIERGSKRVCIVEAKRDDFQQGLAQAYVGCEVLADVEGLTKLYSIVTNFKEWYFSRSLDDRIERFDATITIVNDIPTRESVKMIVEKIYSMLSDDDEPAMASNEAIL